MAFHSAMFSSHRLMEHSGCSKASEETCIGSACERTERSPEYARPNSNSARRDRQLKDGGAESAIRPGWCQSLSLALST